MQHNPIIEIGAVFHERYRILETLSAGGFGVVYKAEQLATGQAVAIKCIRRFGPTPDDDERRLARFQREVRLCAQLHHPNIVRLIDSGWLDQSLYAVFEFVPGQNLAQVLLQEGHLAPVEAGRLMGQVLDALSCAHDAGIIHRDLKPANVMVVSTGARRNAMVLDFGIGGVLREVSGVDAHTLTATFERMGTPAYSSPEQLRGRTLTPETDIYSWGLMFLECLTGQRAIDGTTVAEVMHRQLDDEPVSIPRGLAGHPLEALLRMATAKDAGQRRLGARALLARLEACSLESLDLSGDVVARGLPPEDCMPLASTADASHGATSGGGSSSDRSADLSGRRERRQLTIVSCALSVIGTGATPLELEEQEDLLAEEVAFCRGLARDFECHVDSGGEHRVLLYFGYPRASGDDARRAAHASLTIARAFADRSAERQRSRGIRAEVHIGVHTGVVLVRNDIGRTAISGSAVRAATQMDGQAAPNSVVLSAVTERLVRAYVRLEELAPRAPMSLAGHAEPVALFELARQASIHTVSARADTVPSTADDAEAAPLIGRDQELELLRWHWTMACDGRGQSVLVAGDPGIGKSRLIRELGRELRGTAMHWLQCRCLPEDRNSALQPMIALLQRHLENEPAGADPDRLRALEALLDAHDIEREPAMPLLAPLLGVPLGPEYAPLDLAPQRQRQLLLRVFLSLLSAMAADRPVLLAVEDLHWADATTMELLSLLLEEVPIARMCVVLTTRAGHGNPVTTSATMSLDRLSEDAGAEMIRRCAGGKEIPGEVLDEILRRTDGVPLFVEELVRSILESGLLVEHDTRYSLAGALSTLDIPATLRDILTARLDRLSQDARVILQIAAVLGRDFQYEELEAAVERESESLRGILDELVHGGLLYRRRRLSGELLGFKHALIHDAAYDAMPRSVRHVHHGHIARVIEERFPGLAQKRPELLARHYAGAGEIVAAAEHARRAALQALIESANEEAVGLARQAIDWLRGLADERQRAELELGFHAIISPALLGTRGHGRAEFGALARRSLELIAVVGDSPQTFPTLWGLWIHRYVRAEYDRALPLAENYRERAERLGDSGLRVIAHSILGSTLFYQARFEDSHAACSRVVELYDPEAHRHHMVIVGHDSQTSQLGVRAVAAWMLGRPAQAVADVERALSWSRSLRHPVSICFGLFFVAHIRLWSGQREQAVEATRELLEIAERGGLDNWVQLGGVLHGGATGNTSATRAILAGLEAVEQYIGVSYWHVLVAECEAAAGRTERALAAIDQARDFAERTGEHYFLAEIHRRRGEYLAARIDEGGAPGDAEVAAEIEADAEASLRRAIEVAERQGARLPAFLATASLCRLMAGRGRRDQAPIEPLRALCAEITGGDDLPVIAAARAVLAELDAPAAG